MWLAVLDGLYAAWEMAKAVPAVVYVALAFFAFGFVSGCHGCN